MPASQAGLPGTLAPYGMSTINNNRAKHLPAAGDGLEQWTGNTCSCVFALVLHHGSP